MLPAQDFAYLTDMQKQRAAERWYKRRRRSAACIAVEFSGSTISLGATAGERAVRVGWTLIPYVQY